MSSSNHGGGVEPQGTDRDDGEAEGERTAVREGESLVCGLGVDSGTATQKRRVATLAKRLRRLKTLAARKHPSPQRSGIQT